jgi:hypothetical protein
MKPISTTSEQLMLRSRPWILGLGLICAMLIFAGIAMSEMVKGDDGAAKGPLILLGMFALVFAVFVRQEVVLFDRGAGLVYIRKVTVFGAGEVRHPLDGVVRAEVEKDMNDSSGSKSPTFRPVLVYQGKAKVPLTPIYSSGGDAKVAVAAINGWLKRKT